MNRILDLVAAGLSTEQVLEELPDLEPEDIQAAPRYASIRMIIQCLLHDHPDRRIALARHRCVENADER
jgi:uncharacterized protein (DUF433 family)